MSASNDPGVHVLAAVADDVEAKVSLDHDRKDALDVSQAADNNVEEGSVVAPDQFDEKYQTTKKEIWAYYAWVSVPCSFDGPN